MTRTFHLLLPLVSAALAVIAGHTSLGQSRPASQPAQPPATGPATRPYITVNQIIPGRENGRPLRITVSRSGPADVPLELDYVLTGDSTPSLAYVIPSGHLRFEPGQSTATIDVEYIADNLPDPDRRIRFVVYEDDRVSLAPNLGLRRPPPLPAPLAERLAALDPAVRLTMAPLLATAPTSITSMISLSRDHNRVHGDARGPQIFQQTYGDFLKKGGEVVINDLSPVGLWTLRYGSASRAIFTHYLPPKSSACPFPIVRLAIHNKTGVSQVTALIPAGGSSPNFTWSDDEQGEPAIRCIVPPTVPDYPALIPFSTTSPTALEQNQPLAFQTVLLPTLAAACCVSPTRVFTAFPEVPATQPATTYFSRMIAGLAAEEPTVRASATERLSTLSIQELFFLTRAARGAPIPPESKAAISGRLASEGLLLLTDSEIATRSDKFLIAALEFPNPSVRSFAAQLWSLHHDTPPDTSRPFPGKVMPAPPILPTTTPSTTTPSTTAPASTQPNFRIRLRFLPDNPP